MASNGGGPWGGGGNNGSGNNGGGGDNRRPPQGRRPGDRPQIPEIDDLVSKGREQLRVLMGGGGSNSGGSGPGGGPALTRGTIGLGLLALLVLWLMASFYSVKTEERSVELLLGECVGDCVGQPGLNFAPWPLVTYEILPVTQEQVIEIGEERIGDRVAQARNMDTGLMLTRDENIVDIDFQVVWRIREPERYLFNLADPRETIEAVAESAMREVIAQSDFLPILNERRGEIAETVFTLTQETLDSYDSGVQILRVNLNAAEPPSTEVTVINIDGEVRERSPLAAYRDVQDAEQERDQLQNQAQAYKNRVEAQAEGTAAEILETARGYQARIVNEAEGEASRFVAVLEEYKNAPVVTRERMYLETLEDIFGSSDIILLDDNGGEGGSGVVPYLPLDQLRGTTGGGSN